MSIHYPVRAAVFSTPENAGRAVNLLHDAGFSWEEISVICSDETKEAMFPEGVQETTSGKHSEEALNVAGAGLLGLGGAAIVTGILTTAGTGLVILGALAGVAAAGTFTSLMVARGLEGEAAEYYDQAVQEGKILVSVEIPENAANAEQQRDKAAEILHQAGADPIKLAH